MTATEKRRDPRRLRDYDIPTAAEYLHQAAMRFLGVIYEQAGVTCDADLSEFPAPVFKWEEADPMGFRAAHMLAQAAAAMGFHGQVKYFPRPSGMGSQATKPSLDHYTYGAHPAFIALLMTYAAVQQKDPFKGLRALDLADEWVSLFSGAMEVDK